MPAIPVLNRIEILNEDGERIETVYRKLNMIKPEDRLLSDITHTAIILYKGKGRVAYLGKDSKWYAYYKGY